MLIATFAFDIFKHIDRQGSGCGVVFFGFGGALPSAPRKLECCAPPLLSRNPGPFSCGQVLIVNFVLFECLLAELFRHGKPPVAHRTASLAGL